MDETPGNGGPDRPDAPEPAPQTPSREEYLATLDAGRKGKGGRVAIITGTVVLALAAAAVAVVLRTSDETAALDSLVPDSVAMFAWVSADPSAEQKSALDALSKRFPQVDGKTFAERLEGLLDEAFEDLDLTFRDDVKPWIGAEVAVAVSIPNERAEPEAVAIVAARSEAGARAALDKAKARASEPFEFLVAGGAAYVAEKRAHIDQIVTTVAGGAPVLSSNAAYAKARERVGADNLAAVWIDGDKFQDVLRGGAGIPSLGVPGLPAGFGGAPGTGMFALRAAENGIELQGFAEVDPASTPTTGKPALLEATSSALLGSFTMFDLGALVDQGLTAFQQGFLGMLPGSEQRDMRKEAAAALREAFGLDLEDDVLPWLHGEFSVVVGGFSSPPFPDVGVVIGSTDDAAAKRTIDALRSRLGDLGTALGFEVQGLDDGFAVSGEQGFDVIVRRARGKVVIASTDRYSDQLLAGSDDELADDTVYRSVVGETGGDTTSVVYVRLDRIRTLVEAFLPSGQRKDYETDILPFLRPLQAIGIRTTQKGTESTTRMFVTLGE